MVTLEIQEPVLEHVIKSVVNRQEYNPTIVELPASYVCDITIDMDCSRIIWIWQISVGDTFVFHVE